jgi:hypothetical protein
MPPKDKKLKKAADSEISNNNPRGPKLDSDLVRLYFGSGVQLHSGQHVCSAGNGANKITIWSQAFDLPPPDIVSMDCITDNASIIASDNNMTYEPGMDPIFFRINENYDCREKGSKVENNKCKCTLIEVSPGHYSDHTVQIKGFSTIAIENSIFAAGKTVFIVKGDVGMKDLKLLGMGGSEVGYRSVVSKTVSGQV